MLKLWLTLSLFSPPWVNGVPLPRLGEAALTDGALVADEELFTSLRDDPSAVQLLRKIVECALAPERMLQVDVGDRVELFAGAFGLGDEWAEGPCEIECQEWVSACMLTRINAYGIPFLLSAGGTHPAFAAGGPAAADHPERYPLEEGAFYGNIFVSPNRAYACRGVGEDPLALTFRACTLPGSRCGINAVGPCAAPPGERRACDPPGPDGLYTRCHTRASVPGAEEHPEGDEVYTRVITTFLRPTVFQDGLEAELCGAPDEPTPFGELQNEPVLPGGPCVNEDDCPQVELICDPRAPGGLCSTDCTDNDDLAVEQAACGGEDTTCIQGLGGQAFCTTSCQPGVEGGDCAPGRVCTLPWLVRQADQPRFPGCVPFCSEDAHCNPGSQCHVRTGACTPQSLPSEGLTDGEPCDPTGVSNELPCLGVCVRAGPQPQQGLCASLINAAETRRCPDPGVVPRGPQGEDDLGLCNHRGCAVMADCEAPLVCRFTAFGRVCTWPEE